MSSPRSEFLAGVRAELPILLGVIPFGLIFGVLTQTSGLLAAMGQSLSYIVFAGSAQFIALPLLTNGTPAAIILLTVFIVNLRHMLYSATLAPRLRLLTLGWRWLLAYLLTDEAFVVAVLNYEDEQKPAQHKHYFLLGAGLALWASWNVSTAVGIFFGAQVPAAWGLDFTLAVTFIGMVVPVLKNGSFIITALVAGLTAVLAAPLPFNLGLIVAAIVGVTVGLFLEQRTNQPINQSPNQKGSA